MCTGYSFPWKPQSATAQTSSVFTSVNKAESVRIIAREKRGAERGRGGGECMNGGLGGERDGWARGGL